MKLYFNKNSSTIIPARPLLLFFLFSLLTTCIDDFNPHLKGFEAILVVDALITNENRSYEVRLSRTIADQNSEPDMESGAVVKIRDQNRNESMLYETSAGIYMSDSPGFQGEPDNEYTLYIKTAGGTEYESDPCKMYPVPEIDRIYYYKDQEFQNNGTVIQDGIRIFLDSENAGDSRYFRWIYTECWKFRLPTPKLYDYINQDNIPHVDTVKQVCYCFNESDEIIIHSAESGEGSRIEKQPVQFIASAMSDRLSVQYSIEIKQLSLSDKEYQFWEQMKQINETGGDIFEKQPYSIKSNIHNLNDPFEPVLGYFQVSAVAWKRIFITPDDIAELNLPVYTYDCIRVKAGPADYPEAPDKTFDKIYREFTNSGLYFIGPVRSPFGNFLVQLAFASPVCADCTLRGNLTKPDFWIDIDSLKSKKLRP